MMRRFLMWLSARLPARVITQDGAPYLERYYLFDLLGMRFYLHRFVGDDPDRGLHDHPWRFAFSLVLAGWYIEQTRQGARPVRWVNFLLGDSFHRVILPSAEPVWTLFAHRIGDVKAWGFLERFGLFKRPGEAEALLFLPYRYELEGGKPERWWLTAPKGRDIRKEAA